MESQSLIFVYNADSGIFNGLADWAHKILSPETYACNLCTLTHSNFGMHQDWRQFIETLGIHTEFLYRNELYANYAINNISLPAILHRQNTDISVWIDANKLSTITSLEQLKEHICKKIHP